MHNESMTQIDANNPTDFFSWVQSNPTDFFVIGRTQQTLKTRAVTQICGQKLVD